MKYEMQFCVNCYMPDALALARSLLESNPHDAAFSLTLVPGQSGSFEVKRDDQVVYSKMKSGRLPTPHDLGLANYRTVLPMTEDTGSDRCC